MPGPMTPDEIRKLKTEQIPEEVYETFNQAIATNFTGSSSLVTQREIVELLGARNITERQAIDNGWLDIEPAYQDSGWEVTFDAPGYNENYSARWTFTRKRGMS